MSRRSSAALGHLQQATMWLMQNAMAKPDNAGAGATDYMHLFGLVALRLYVGADGQGRAGQDRERRRRSPISPAKLVTGRFFMERMLPETALHLARIQTGRDHDGIAGRGVLIAECFAACDRLSRHSNRLYIMIVIPGERHA